MPSGRAAERASRSTLPRRSLLCLGRAPAALVWLALSTAGCDSPVSLAPEPISVGLLLSYSGAAAGSINSERALLMALDAANRAGGVGGRPLQLVARDTGSDETVVRVAARELVGAGVAILIGPDTPDLATQLRELLTDRTVMLPSFATASEIMFKPNSWFVMGPPTARVACELVEQLRQDARQKPVVVVNPSNGYNSELTWELVRRHGMPKVTLPADEALSRDAFAVIANLQKYDAYVLAALPATAAALVYSLNAADATIDPTQWYLSPTLHTNALLETIPRQILQGARGMSPGTAGGAATDFRSRFQAEWQDEPLDDAYSFYDAGAVVTLALERALLKEGTIPPGTGLVRHIRAVTAAGGQRITWDAIDEGLRLLRGGSEVEYEGLSGVLRFDEFGQTPPGAASTKWWTISQSGFQDLVSTSNACASAMSAAAP
jgi:ABC-type branched-subunit amino acid transport system substrate-binding protein